jgi:chromosome segregation protein
MKCFIIWINIYIPFLQEKGILRLKKLIIHGFKSFADKTVIEFQPGMTAIVGPNGCGKSNIVDALRFVMGETQAKAIRGEKMNDILFNGTKTRTRT